MSSATPTAVDVHSLVKGTAAIKTGEAFRRNGSLWSYQFVLTGPAAVSGTASVEVSNDGSSWVPFGSLSVSGNSVASDLITGNAPWAFHRARIDTLSGTGVSAEVIAAGT